MAITFNTGVDITEGTTTFADLFSDDDARTTYYRLWTGDVTPQGQVIEGSVVETDLGGGWVTAENLDTLLVTGDQAGHNTLYVQTYNPRIGKGEWANDTGFDFPEAQDLEMTFDTSVAITEDMPLDQVFSFTAPSGVDNDEIWFQFKVDGENIDTDLGFGWVRGDNLANEMFLKEYTGGELTVLPYYDGAKQIAETGTWDVPAGGDSFTLTESDAVVTANTSTGVSPEDATFTDGDDTVEGVNKLTGDTILQDGSTADNDTLTAYVSAAQTPLITNVENIEIQSTADAASLDFANITGAKNLEIAGTTDFGALNFVQDGSILTTLTSASDVTLTTAENAADDDEFDLAVNGAEGSITLADGGGGNAADVIVNLASEGTATNELELDADPADIVVSELNITGSADLELAANPNTGSAIDLSAQVVDASEHEGELSLVTDATGAIDAEDWDGVDNLVLTGTYNNTISNLAADVTVVSTSDDTLVGIANQDGVTEQDVLLGSATDAALTVTTLTANDVDTLNIATDDTEMDGTDRDHTVGTLNGTSLQSLNVTAAEEAPFVLTNAYTTRDGVAGDRAFTATFDGEGDTTLTGGITSGTGIDTITIEASGAGDRDLGTLTTTDMSDGGSVTITGDSDVTVDDIVDTGATSKTIDLNSDAAVTIADMNFDITAGETSTINSESTDGTGGVNEVTDASNIAFLTAGGSTLEITGNQDLKIGTDTAGTELALGAIDGEENTLDASAFTGDLELYTARDNTAGTSETQTIKLGTADSTVSLIGDSGDATDDVFSVVFSEDGLGTVEIANFSVTNVEDVLDFSAYSENQGTFALAGGEATLTMDGGDYDGETITFEDNADGDAVGTSDLFEGEITLSGVSTADLEAANFNDFA